MPIRPKKVVRMVVKRVRAQFKQSPLFLRLIPTDKCSLACGYCFQHSNAGADMPADMAIEVLDHARKLGTAVVSFLGGEPLQWKPLEATIAYATKLKMITDITTHGMLLTDARMESLIGSGLDYLNISVDGLKPDGVSKKCALGNGAFVARLHRAQKAGVKVRINSVLYNDNREKVRAIMEVCQREGFPLSIGFVVPDPHKGEEAFHLSRMSEEDRRAWVAEMRERMAAGCKIIDPEAYFEGLERYLKGEKFWLCNYPRRLGWVNVTPNGKLRTCTKKMDEEDLLFTELTSEKLKAYRKGLRAKVATCNASCYSNCAFDGAYYRKHPVEFLKTFLGG